MRVLVLGAGFGGLELTTTLSEEFGEDVEITLIDKADSFVFGFSKLDVMFGRTDSEHVSHRYADIVKPGVNFVQAEITAIDASAKHVETTAGSFDGDFLVIALGADYDLDYTPGLAESGCEYYANSSAFEHRRKIEAFNGGRVIVGVTSAPFKCPPAPSETALLMHDDLVAKGVREQSSISLVMPFGRPIPPSPDASAALIETFAEHGIEWCPDAAVASVDAANKTITTSNGDVLDYDLLLCVPHHVAPQVLKDSGLTEDGWVPVNPLTLETPNPGVYAVGDVAAVGTPRAGVFAEGQAQIAAEQIADKIRESASSAQYSGRGICYIEFGEHQVGMIDVEFFGEKKLGILSGPGAEYAAKKEEFGKTRAKRWFGSDWTNT